jgi:urease gamma subunit
MGRKEKASAESAGSSAEHSARYGVQQEAIKGMKRNIRDMALTYAEVEAVLSPKAQDGDGSVRSIVSVVRDILPPEVVAQQVPNGAAAVRVGIVLDGEMVVKHKR